MLLIAQSAYGQELFNNNVARLGHASTDKQVSAAVLKSVNDMITGALNIPTGNDKAPDARDGRANTSIATVQTVYTAQQATSTSLVLLGEAHNNQQDHQRAESYIAAMNTVPPTLTPTLVVFERALNYPAPGHVPVVRESNLTQALSGGGRVDFGEELSRVQRSMVVGGYLALCVASGNQHDINRVMLFYGANHNDILTYFDYFARHTAGYYVLKETRILFNIRSYQP
jgi:hypothetical protein